MPDESVHVSQLRFDPKNARKHPRQNLQTLEKSLSEVGAGRSILLAKDGTIIAGNATVEVAAQAGFETVKIIESDGTELIAVRRTDVDSSDPQFTKMALYDNLSSEQAEWDTQTLQDFQEVPEFELDHIFSKGFLTQLAQDDAIVADDVWSPTEDDRWPVKRWTFQFTHEQHELVRRVLDALVKADSVEKRADNPDVYSNALVYVLERSVYDGR